MCLPSSPVLWMLVKINIPDWRQFWPRTWVCAARLQVLINKQGKHVSDGLAQNLSWNIDVPDLHWTLMEGWSALASGPRSACSKPPKMFGSGRAIKPFHCTGVCYITQSNHLFRGQFLMKCGNLVLLIMFLFSVIFMMGYGYGLWWNSSLKGSWNHTLER